MAEPLPQLERTSHAPTFAVADAPIRGDVLEVLQRYWGYDSLRPLQAQAIDAGLCKRDSLVVMPTGGGKSLCFQVPAALAKGLTVVVSPLISLMKDQVDGLALAGYPAAALHSGMDPDAASRVRAQVADGELKLLYVSPERLVGGGFMSWLAKLHDAGNLAGFAIDEAHCISQWGHDFRPEYRQLATVREALPRVAFHAFTATATPRVREDIARQLALRDPQILVGIFDRPNLTYRVLPRTDVLRQSRDILIRYKDNASIVYCISRKDCESLAQELTQVGIKAKAYHAGLSPAVRSKVQTEFQEERLNVVVATVAFGMGIDRGDVRCVIHAAMPKTVEHYQQETGRAGRDGLAAECVLLYSASDGPKWLSLMERSAAESDADPASIREGLAVSRELLKHMQQIVGSARCRHAALSEYFGQQYTPPRHPASEADAAPRGCGACDVCLGELESVPDATTIARKILSCVYRVGQRFGTAHVADVLKGSKAAKIIERGHDQLSTFGLLKDLPRERIVQYIQQLVDMGLLEVEVGDYPLLRLATASGPVLKGEREVALFRQRGSETTDKRAIQSASRLADATAALSPDEKGLFEELRLLRRDIAADKGVPPYVVFGDVTLEELARVRPSSPDRLLGVRGIGNIKLQEFGAAFIDRIATYCATHNMPLDAIEPSRKREAPREERVREAAKASGTQTRDRLRADAARCFEQDKSVAETAAAINLSVSTTSDYLCTWIELTKPKSIAPWVDQATYARIESALDELSGTRLRPIWEQLEGQVSYEQIKAVIAHLRAGV